MGLWLWPFCAVNLAAFAAMGVDKRRARKGRWRVRERTLWLLAVCFGALGGTLGMWYFRHKTRHAAFFVGFPTLLFVQAGLLLYWLWE